VPEKTDTTEDSSHIQRLLRAKHKAAEDRQDDNEISKE